MHADNEIDGSSLPQPEQVELAVEMFRMLADPTRVQLLWALRDHELPVNYLAETIGKAPAAVSQHLAKLRLAGMVRTRRQGNQVFYRVENEHVGQLVEDAIFHAEHAADDFPQHHRSDRHIDELPARRHTADSGRAPHSTTTEQVAT